MYTNVLVIIEDLSWVYYTSQRTLTMFVGVVALRYQHHITHVLCCVDNGVPQNNVNNRTNVEVGG